MHTTYTDGYVDTIAPTDQKVSTTKELLEVTANYYKDLMAEKPSDDAASEPFISKLRQRPLSKAAVKSLEGAITLKEVRASIRSLAKRKACGPDAPQHN